MSLNPNSPSRDHLDNNKLLIAHPSYSAIRFFFPSASTIRAFRTRVLDSDEQPPKLGLNTFQSTTCGPSQTHYTRPVYYCFSAHDTRYVPSLAYRFAPARRDGAL
jgi:hypothetical protein